MFVGTGANADTNLLINGDFGAGTLAGWTWVATQYAEPQINPSVVIFETIPTIPSLCFRVNPGTDEAHFGLGQEEGGVLSQTISLVVGTEYTVSIGAVAIQNLSISNVDGGLIQLYIAGNLQWSWNVDYIDAHITVRNSYSGTYVPSYTGLHDFELVFTRTYRNYSPVIYHYVDDISVIPEPATILLLGLGGLVLLINPSSTESQGTGTRDEQISAALAKKQGNF